MQRIMCPIEGNQWASGPLIPPHPLASEPESSLSSRPYIFNASPSSTLGAGILSIISIAPR